MSIHVLFPWKGEHWLVEAPDAPELSTVRPVGRGTRDAMEAICRLLGIVRRSRSKRSGLEVWS